MNSQTKLIIGLVSLLVAAGILFVIFNRPAPEAPAPITDEIPTPVAPAIPTSTQAVIGSSAGGKDIEVYTFGTGKTNLLFVGGIHGGYEWNSVQLAYEAIETFQNETIAVPDNITVHIIPNLNPDGLYIATGLEGKIIEGDITDTSMHTNGIGRFNANDVDLNRNFDCRWTKTGVWKGNTVSAGANPFSEPEAITLRNYVEAIKPTGAIFWHSKAGNVYGSECGGGVAPETLTLMRTYAGASGYGEVPVFDAYVVTGAAEDWLASIGVPTVSVELTSRTSSEKDQNLAGTRAVLDLYGK